MPPPTLTDRQFVVLGALLAHERSGREIRERLREAGYRMSLPGFYQLMARLEDENLVAGWYESIVVAGQALRERRYKVRAEGRRAWDRTWMFFDEQAKVALSNAKGVAHA